MHNAILILSKLGLGGLFCLPFLVPMHTNPLPGFYPEWLAASLAAISILGLLAHPKVSPVNIPKIVFLPAGLAALLMVQLFTTDYAHQAQYRLATSYLLLAVAVMLLARVLANEMGRERLMALLCWATLAGGLASTAIAIVQHWQLDTPLNAFILPSLSRHSYGNLAQTNHLAAQLAMAAASLHGLYASRRLNLPASLALLTALMLALSLTGSRSAWLYVSAMPLLALLFRWRSPGEPARRLTRLALVAIPLFILFQYLLALPWSTPHAVHAQAQAPEVITSGLATASERLSALNTVLGTRAILWLDAWKVFLANPILGAGFQEFSWHLFQIEAKTASPIYWLNEQHAWGNCHNLPLQLLAELGIGAALILVLFAYWLHRALRDIDTVERWTVLAILTVILTHSLVEYPLNYAYFMLPTAALMALSRDDCWLVTIRRPLMASLFVVGFGYATISVAQTWNDYRALEAISAATEGAPGQYNESQLNTLASLQQDSPLSSEADSLLNRIAVPISASTTWPAFLSISERVMRHETAAPHVYRHIFLLALNDRLDEASNLLSQASHVFPKFLPYFKALVTRISLSAPDNTRLLRLRALLDKEIAK